MNVRILGCSGGKTPEEGLTSFLVDGRLLIDAGSCHSALSLAEQAAVRHVLITHSHLDHICGLIFLYDNTRQHRQGPLQVFGPPAAIRALREHFFIPEIMAGARAGENGEDLPGLVLQEIEPRRPTPVGRYEVEAVKVNHPAGGVGYFVSDGERLLLNTGDTGRTEDVWKMCKERPPDILITEVSFPNAQQKVADLSCHLTPRDLPIELGKAGWDGRRVYLSHLKPAFAEELGREITELEGFELLVLRPGDVLHGTKPEDASRALRQRAVVEKVKDKVPVFDLGKDLYDQREQLDRDFAVRFPAGEMIFEQGDQSRVSYVVREGKVSISRTILGVEKVLATLGPGEVFGELAMLNNRPRSATARALTDVILLAFVPKAFEKLIQENWGVGLKIIRTLAYRIQDADIQIENLMYGDPESRVVNTLIRAADDEGLSTAKGRLVRLTPEDLSQRTGLSAGRLKEVLAGLIRDHLIHIQKDAVLIPDASRLQRLLTFFELRKEFR